MNADEQAIRDLIAEWLRASKAADHAAVLELMAEDVVFLLPGQSPMRGRAAFAEAQQGISDFDLDATSEIQEIKVFGDWAYCWNFLTVTFTSKTGGPAGRRAGPVLSTMHKENGRWVIFRDANMLTKIDH